jgi:hypothetical protein
MNDDDIRRAFTRTFPGEHRPRISSRKFAEMLGVTHEELCEWIEEHRDELERHGPVIQTKAERK